MPRHSGNQPLGSQLGRSLTDLVADTVVKIRHRMGPMEQAHRIEAQNAWMEDAEQRLQPLVKSIVDQFPDTDADGNPVTHPEVIQQLKDMAADPGNQTDFLIFLFAAFGSIAALLGDLGQIAAVPYVQRGWQEQVDGVHSAKVTNLLPPEMAAALFGRGKLAAPDAIDEVKRQGFDSRHLDLMTRAAEGPPALGSLLALWARGSITDADIASAMSDSLIDPKYFDMVKNAFYSTMPAPEVVQAAIKGVIDDDQGKLLYKVAGGLDHQWDLVKESAGDSIGAGQAATLYNHKLISLEDLQAVIRYTRINPRFEPMAELLRFHFLPAFQIVRALTAGTVSADDATRWLTEDGYPADQVTALVSGAHKDKAAKHHDLSESMILDLYNAGEIQKSDAYFMLESIGYDESEVGYILELQDAKRVLASQAEAVKAVRAAVLAGTITTATASTELDGIGIGHVARDTYLRTWTFEHAQQAKRLSMAQVGSALKLGFITVDDAGARWEHMGYPIEDIGILIQLYPPPVPGGAV